MTIQAQQALIAKEIEDLYGSFLLHGGFLLSKDDFQLRRILNMCSKLESVDFGHGCLLRTQVLQLTGDIGDVELYAQKAADAGWNFHAAWSLMIAYSNLGYTTKAAAIYAERSVGTACWSNDFLPVGLSCFSIKAAQSALRAFELAGGTARAKDLVMQAEVITATLTQLEVPEEVVQALMDEAGSILRARRLLWLNNTPDFIISDPDRSPFVAINYRVRVQPEVAAEMNWLLAERLAEINLMPHGVTVGFIGEMPSEENAQ